MANRYLVASGDLTDPVWASTSGGAAGSAPTPTTDDTVILDNASYTVTLDQAITVDTLAIAAGTFTANDYAVTTNVYEVSGSGTKTINYGSGWWTINLTAAGYIDLIGTNATHNASSTSKMAINVAETGAYFATNSKTFNDVYINMGTDSTSTELDISGTPVFRILSIKSANSAAHTVIFEDYAQVQYEKLIVHGSSSSNRLRIATESGDTYPVYFDPVSTSATTYGQYADMAQADISSPTVDASPYYIGSNSVQGSGNGWLLQDPPKIFALVDPLTTAPGSNSNWTVTGTVNQITSGYGGGGYELTDGDSLVSSGTFDLVGSSLVFEIPNIESRASSSDDFKVSVGEDAGSGSIYIRIHYGEIYTHCGDEFTNWNGELSGIGDFFRVRMGANGAVYLENSLDGVTWSELPYSISASLDPELFRSVRVRVSEQLAVAPDAIPLGSINTLPNNTGAFLQFF